MKKITVSAPGKLHLSGEHAVVYGRPALLVTTSQRLAVTIQEGDAHHEGYLAQIIKLVENRYKTSFAHVAVTVNSEIPIGAGMGSSAALAVATVGALAQYIDRPWDITEINSLAYEAEKLQHSNPSGGDNSIVCSGGLLWYRKEFDFLKTFWSLPFFIPKNFSPFTLINTGRKETAGDLVTYVSSRDSMDNDKIFNEIEKVTKKIVQAIHDENQDDFKQNIQKNEFFLEELGVVSNSTKILIRDIESHGGVAKISGAGGIQKGSGVVLAIHDNPKIIINIAKKHKLPSFQVRLSEPGVRVERVLV
jgi:mevalonate kinase